MFRVTFSPHPPSGVGRILYAFPNVVESGDEAVAGLLGGDFTAYQQRLIIEQWSQRQTDKLNCKLK